MLKRFFSIITISLIITGSFFSAYNIKYPVYADSNTDGWMNVTTNEQLADAFRYYCKSRDLTIEGSVADGVTSFTTKTFNGLCNTLGIDITALQAQIKYKTDSNIGTQFLFTTTGVDAYNRIFSQFLQDNDLEVGDEVNENVYDGVWFNDGHNNGCYIYVVTAFGTINGSNILKVGTDYRKSSNQIYNDFLNGISTFDFYLGDSVLGTRTLAGSASNVYDTGNKNGQWNILTSNGEYPHGQYVVISSSSGDRLYYGLYVKRNNTGYGTMVNLYEITNSNDKTVTNAPIYITTNNTVINNNTYEGDTIINNNGDIINNNNPDPNPNPTPDPPTIPDSGGWQDFSLPEMPNDWLIYGMEKKFPFDIPFNILFALSLLNHEPEIPKFEGDIDLQVCTWHYDIDLTPFDDIATILRKFEVLGFIIGLAILTKNLINWG